jgi:lipopolysaccharide/colanic/teichoic acid biosynthesis glycosyltransferase
MTPAVETKRPQGKSYSFPSQKTSVEGRRPSRRDHGRHSVVGRDQSPLWQQSAHLRPVTPFPLDHAENADSPTFQWKRGLDLSCIALSLPIVLPLMALIVIWIRLVSRGPALFCQERIGKDGKKFVLYKFRSMKMNALTSLHESYLKHLVKSDSPMIKLDLLCDSRVIPGGCLLRAAGLDELPQLLNVLRGEMSLVGPRPCLAQEYVFFSTEQRERFGVPPGLTGSWQVSGKNRATFSEMNEMDIHYARETSLFMDLAIMLKTPSVLIHQMFQAAHPKFTARQVSVNSQHQSDAKCESQRIG